MGPSASLFQDVTLQIFRIKNLILIVNSGFLQEVGMFKSSNKLVSCVRYQLRSGVLRISYNAA